MQRQSRRQFESSVIKSSLFALFARVGITIGASVLPTAAQTSKTLSTIAERRARRKARRAKALAAAQANIDQVEKLASGNNPQTLIALRNNPEAMRALYAQDIAILPSRGLTDVTLDQKIMDLFQKMQAYAVLDPVSAAIQNVDATLIPIYRQWVKAARAGLTSFVDAVLGAAHGIIGDIGFAPPANYSLIFLTSVSNFHTNGPANFYALDISGSATSVRINNATIEEVSIGSTSAEEGAFIQDVSLQNLTCTGSLFLTGSVNFIDLRGLTFSEDSILGLFVQGPLDISGINLAWAKSNSQYASGIAITDLTYWNLFDLSHSNLPSITQSNSLSSPLISSFENGILYRVDGVIPPAAQISSSFIYPLPAGVDATQLGFKTSGDDFGGSNIGDPNVLASFLGTFSHGRPDNQTDFIAQNVPGPNWMAALLAAERVVQEEPNQTVLASALDGFYKNFAEDLGDFRGFARAWIADPGSVSLAQVHKVKPLFDMAIRAQKPYRNSPSLASNRPAARFGVIRNALKRVRNLAA